MKLCPILECRHNQQEGCPHQDCYFITDNDDSKNMFETVLFDPDYKNAFYIKKYGFYTGKPYKISQRGKFIDLGFASLCTSDNIKMNGARLFDKRTGEFVCFADELNDLADIRKIVESLFEMPDIDELPRKA